MGLKGYHGVLRLRKRACSSKYQKMIRSAYERNLESRSATPTDDVLLPATP